jgi:hypothetical protein
MKKLIILGSTIFLIQSCTVFKHEHDCSQSITNLINYEDTIKVEFKGIDSLIFKNKNYKHVADSLLWNYNNIYMRIDVKNIRTGYIHRIVFNRNVFDRYPYDEINYEWIK